MFSTPDPETNRTGVAAALREHYGIDVIGLAPARAGMMALAFEARTAGGSRWFVKQSLEQPCHQVATPAQDAAPGLPERIAVPGQWLS